MASLSDSEHDLKTKMDPPKDDSAAEVSYEKNYQKDEEDKENKETMQSLSEAEKALGHKLKHIIVG